jgi:SAM-dependent methyltransferase
MTILALMFIAIQLLFALLIFYLTIAFIFGAPFVPSAKDEAESMIAIAGIKPGMKVYDLGSGDGRILFKAAKLGAHAIGFEINPFLVFFTKLRARFLSYGSRVEAFCMNFWYADVRDADVVFVYLIPWRMTKLKQKLLSQLKPGSLVVSNSFIFRGWKIHRMDPKRHIYAFKISRQMIVGS